MTRGRLVSALHAGNSISTGPDLTELDQVTKDKKKAELDPTTKWSDGAIYLAQTHLMDNIHRELILLAKLIKAKSTMAAFSKLLGHPCDTPVLQGTKNNDTTLALRGSLLDTYMDTDSRKLDPSQARTQ